MIIYLDSRLRFTADAGLDIGEDDQTVLAWLFAFQATMPWEWECSEWAMRGLKCCDET